MYTMNETCSLVNMAYETLKYCCNMGLVKNVKRRPDNHRIFDDFDADWFKNPACRKKEV